MNTELKAPKFVEEFANYLVAIRNLSQVYINNMKVTKKLDKQWYINLAKQRLKDFGIVFFIFVGGLLWDFG